MGEAAARAGATAAKEAARGAARDLVAGDPPRKARARKLLAFFVVGLCLLLGLVGLVVHYWVWFLGLGLVGVAGIVGYARARAALAARRNRESTPRHTPSVTSAARLAPASPNAPTVPVDAPNEAARAAGCAEAEALAVEEELAALKARVGAKR